MDCVENPSEHINSYLMGYRIFVFEDNVEMIELLREIFRLKGDDLISFQPGLSIIEQVQKVTPDIILVDLRMTPTGQEIIALLKSDPVLRNIPILLFTASNIKKSEVEAMGVQGIIHKPFSLDDIERNIDKTIRKSKNLQL